MLHKAQVLVRTPGKNWAVSMQAKRTEIASAIDLDKHNELDVGELINDHLMCGGYFGSRDIAIKSLDGRMVDDGSLEYEFVTYDRAQHKIIIAVFIGDGNVGSPIRFAKLFPGMRYGEAFESDRAFLVVPPVKGFRKGWALQPTGRDSHDDYGFSATPGYLQKLLKATQ